MNEAGYVPPEITDINECTGCMNCMIYCPDFAIVVEKDAEDDSDMGENTDE
jgi:2-oxoglutarate ferredoxin oxidoreductase subunit delta